MPVDAHFRTNVPGVYAIGDLIDGPMLAHKAEDEGVAVAEILAGKPATSTTTPSRASSTPGPRWPRVGLTEEQAQGRRADYKVGKFPFLANGRAKAMDETEGLVKILADARPTASSASTSSARARRDMIAEASPPWSSPAAAEDIARICHAHPTALGGRPRGRPRRVDKRAIHA